MTGPNEYSLDAGQTDLLLDYLSRFVTPNKQQKIDRVLDFRTRYVTVALEDIYQTQNASACIRSCDLFGIQDLHVIENRNPLKINKDVVQGASKWVDIHRYGPPDPDPDSPRTDRTERCLHGLRTQGYLLAAATPEEADITVDDLPLERPIALLFGSEEPGLTSAALDLSVLRVRIPMFGFSQSFNISVSVALSLHSVVTRLHKSAQSWRLTVAEIQDLKLRWYRKVIHNGDLLAKQFIEEQLHS